MKNHANYGEENTINLKLVIALSRSNTSFQRVLQTFFNNYDLTIAQFGVLETLFHLGDLKIGELIDKTLSTSGNMTVVIRNLEKEGLIKRQVNVADRRAFVIGLTDEGRSLIKEVFDAHLAVLEGFFINLDQDEKKLLQKMLKKLNGLD
ncbi:MarR family transcriptional regulator [Fusibacter bizertensis]|uniref:MarR family transcriptional regulator n=1 Tax=Fusibacter bizertensis TaxID=1488331 RepID=A0ABT6NGH4_9FIRM|nr:MarR family transcriptional regulator [Fusibacter bizertensis]MDH8679538.1 MarR family transcriptional regulator [Fusibacter bizertensis]